MPDDIVPEWPTTEEAEIKEAIAVGQAIADARQQGKAEPEGILPEQVSGETPVTLKEVQVAMVRAIRMGYDIETAELLRRLVIEAVSMETAEALASLESY